MELNLNTREVRSLPPHSVDLYTSPVLWINPHFLCCSRYHGRSTDCHSPTSPSFGFSNSCLPETNPVLWSQEVACPADIHGSIFREF